MARKPTPLACIGHLLLSQWWSFVFLARFWSLSLGLSVRQALIITKGVQTPYGYYIYKNDPTVQMSLGLIVSIVTTQVLRGLARLRR